MLRSRLHSLRWTTTPWMAATIEGCRSGAWALTLPWWLLYRGSPTPVVALACVMRLVGTMFAGEMVARHASLLLETGFQTLRDAIPKPDFSSLVKVRRLACVPRRNSG